MTDSLKFTLIPVKKKGEPTSAIKCIRYAIPNEMKEALQRQAYHIIRGFERSEPDLQGAFWVDPVTKTPEGLEMLIWSRQGRAKEVMVHQYGIPPRGGLGPKPITFYSPERLAEVISQMHVERAAWIAGGKKGPNPFTKEAEQKLITEGKLIRRGEFGGLPGKHFVEKVVIDQLKRFTLYNFKKAIEFAVEKCTK